MIRPCNCENRFQDKAYGKGKRVWNATLKGARCTSCGRKDDHNSEGAKN